MGQQSTTVDEASSHVSHPRQLKGSKTDVKCAKLVKLATDRTGTIKSSETIGDMLSVQVAKRITALVDVKMRHEQAHPNLVPATLLKKLFLLERAMESARHHDLSVMRELLNVTLIVTPQKDKVAYLQAWREDGHEGWQSYDQTQIDRFV